MGVGIIRGPLISLQSEGLWGTMAGEQSFMDLSTAVTFTPAWANSYLNQGEDWHLLWSLRGSLWRRVRIRQYSAGSTPHTMINGLELRRRDTPRKARFQLSIFYRVRPLVCLFNLFTIGAMHAFSSSHLLLSSPVYSWLACGPSPHTNNRVKVSPGDLTSHLPQVPNFSRHGNMGGISADRWTFSSSQLR